MLKILSVHNSYQHYGGEDGALEAETLLLQSKGHEVVRYCRQNSDIADYSTVKLAGLAQRAIWATDTYRDLVRLALHEKPDVAHFHNILPLISPSAYYACKKTGIPVIQAIENYRLLCPGGNLYRDGQVCRECIDHSLLRGIQHGCYRDSRLQTAVVASMLALHRRLGTWTKMVDVYLVCTGFARNMLVSHGFPPEKVMIKPNFLFDDPGPRSESGYNPLVIARLSPEKGVRLLPKAWSYLDESVPLTIAGDGPLRAEIESEFARREIRTVRMVGWLPRSDALRALRSAPFLVFPSECYEGFPLAIAEAYACGVPVIAPGHGSAGELVIDGKIGLHFKPGDARDLAAKVQWAWAHPSEMAQMGHAARLEYENRYTSERNYKILLAAYERVVARRVS